MPAPSPCPRARCARRPGPVLARTFGLPSGARPAGGDVAGVAGWRRAASQPAALLRAARTADTRGPTQRGAQRAAG